MSDPICAKHPKGRFPANGVGHSFFRRHLLAAALLPLWSVTPCPGQLIDSLAPNGPVVADEPPEPVVWEITPAAEPTPALEYRLWPARESLEPGNTMVAVSRALVMLLESHDRLERSKQYAENQERWLEGPIDQFPKEEVREYLEAHRHVLAELHRMTTLVDSEFDLGIDNLSGMEMIYLPLPEIQNSRELARLLVLEARLALAEGRFEDALRSMRAGVRLGESIGNAGDLLIIKLVGIAITNMSIGLVETASELPNTPNLYWALATIPESTYDIRAAIEFESMFVSRVFPQLTTMPEETLGDSAWRTRLVQSTQDLRQLQSLPDDSQGVSSEAQLLAGLAVLALTEKSRAQLVDAGLDAETVQQMSPSEAVVRATAQSARRIQDEFAKWLYLPDTLRAGVSEWAERATFGPTGLPSDLASVMAGLLLPAIRAADTAALRTAQSIAKLATVQAMRDHAAQHGQLPASLAELRLPAWPDPFTGDPFGYTRKSPTEAILTSAPTYGDDPNAEITIRLLGE